jgi:hypothetical protein
MKATLLSIGLLFLLLTLTATSGRPQTVVAFDDLPNSTTGTFIASPYRGLSWSNFAVVDPILMSNAFGYSVGYGYGMVSPSNVALNANGNPAEIDARGTNFNFLSTYLTGAWNSNLNIEVQGFRNGTLIYDQTVVAAATNATLFTFDYLDVDRLYFNSFGGQPAFGPNNDETHFAMDNFTFEFVPEPSSLLLTAGGVLTLWAFLKRKQARRGGQAQKISAGYTAGTKP